jgi:nucleotide-binding universal stress UspA family protein
MVAVDNRGISSAVIAWLTERGSYAAEDFAVEIITVAEVGWIPAGTAEVDYRNAYEQALWSTKAAVSAALPQASILTTMVWGAPAELLVDASARADILVLGSDKTGTITGFVSGTLPLRISAHSRCPVVVVPSGWTPGPRCVLVGLSLEPSDDAVVEFAAIEADRARSELRLVHALPIPTGLLASDILAPVTYSEIRDSADRLMRAAAVRIRARYPDLPVTFATVDGSAARALAVEGANAHLVVVGTHGRGALRRLALGSVGHDLLLNSSCPVAVIRNRELGR